MKINIGDYLIETDERQFKVKSYVGKDKDGQDTYKTRTYCTTLKSALKFVPQQALRDNDDILVIKEKLEQINANIEAMRIGGLKDE